MYELRVSGRLPADLLGDLDELNVTAEPAQTVLLGTLADQSALFGLIARIHGIGLQLLEVRLLTDEDTDSTY